MKNDIIEDLYFIKSDSFIDERGTINEVVKIIELENVWFNIVQVTHTVSKPRVLRGLHASSCNRIIYPVSGEIFVAFADIRWQSKTFKKVVTAVLTGGMAVFIPANVANSFCVLGNEKADYLYLSEDYYDNQEMTSVAWNDPELNIQWPIDNPIISEKDKHNKTLKQLYEDN